ncbi:hypothetical protein L5515_017305 [Caenorhabditis briggsae]|uniref:Uncharacterized protein n=1 Tax=Caenorhabditis briggsae TaxID=6238 RepID=A0AAE9FCV7_CAEBR|nr:hypothetical protein L5515_017305 [Caenorhabditis briggsae]
MDKPINIGPDGSRVQTPDDQHHDAENMYSRIRKRRANETCESYLNDVQDHDADNIYERIYKRPSRGITKSSTTNETTSMSNVQTAINTTNHSNATNSTEDRLADKKTIQNLGNKYGETIALHKKASAEVERLTRLETSHKEKLEDLISKRRFSQNQCESNSYSRRICETLLLIHANEEDIKKALEIEKSTKDDKETAEAEWKFKATNITNHSNATNSTKDRLAIDKTILDLGNKYSETIPLHKKASAEVKRDKRHNKKRPAVNRSEWTWTPGHLPEIPQTRFPKGVPQGPKRIPSYTVEDLDKEWSRKELPSRQSGRYAQYDPESYFEQELLKETNWKKFLKEEKAARKSQ